MTLLLLGILIFLGIHSVSILAPAWRSATAARFGEPAWKSLYSVVALLGFVLLVLGYSAARQAPVILYVPPAGLRHIALLLMLPVFPLFLATYLPGRISRAARHPTLLAVKLWATAHLLANGMLADVLLFGTLLAWAVADRISMKRRVARPLPAAALAPRNDVFAVALGLVLYAVFLMGLHQMLFGVAPLP